MFFKLIGNPMMWMMRFALLCFAVICIPVGCIGFFSGGFILWVLPGWFYVEFKDFHNGLRKMTKNPDAEKGFSNTLEYANAFADNPIPLRASVYHTNATADSHQAGQNVGGWVAPVTFADDPKKNCPTCKATFYPPYPRRCKYCSTDLENHAEARIV